MISERPAHLNEPHPGGIERFVRRFLAVRARPRSVLHVSYMVHIPHHTVRLLRRHGYDADYLAVGRSPYWDRSDYVYEATWPGEWRAAQEWWWFWRVLARYETVHFHFMTTLTRMGWEVAALKRLGRAVVAHFRGCEARDRARNMALHPQMNICQQCDYSPPICGRPESALRRQLALDHADAVLVTTPDMKDFLPDAVHFPFFAPTDDILPARREPHWPDKPTFRIVHATVHPGIEGTDAIRAAVDRLRARGLPVELEFIRDAPHAEVLARTADADLAIGKMKMGYYANNQIESMCCGVPTVTWVRPDLMTPELAASGFIFARLDELERVIEHYVTHPGELARKRETVRASILRLHDNAALTRRLIALYDRLNGRGSG